MVQVKALSCPNCGASIPDTSKACEHCGSRVILSDDRQKFVLAGTLCPKCGFDNKEQHRFCSKCGEKLFRECPKCHKEIGLDSIHCSACGENIEGFERQRDIDREKLAASQKELKQLQEKLLPLNAEAAELQRKNETHQQRGALSFFWYPGIALVLLAV